MCRGFLVHPLQDYLPSKPIISTQWALPTKTIVLTQSAVSWENGLKLPPRRMVQSSASPRPEQ